jgi:hypothetical protein
MPGVTAVMGLWNLDRGPDRLIACQFPQPDRAAQSRDARSPLTSTFQTIAAHSNVSTAHLYRAQQQPAIFVLP